MKMPTENAATNLESLIVSAAAVAGGKPCIRGHRIPVHRIARWWQLGLSVDEIAEKHPSLGPAEIHGALAYFHLNREEIERYIAEDRAVLATAAASSVAV